tara:strand:+ start:64 stop:702 length:639 start_codon:yes stop_codon:yes gene_type:complete
MTNIIVKPGIGYIDTLITNIILITIPFWNSIHVTPNILTTFGLFSSAACIYFLYMRNFWPALAFMIARMYFDYADGLLARKYKQVTKIGDWYDHVTDILFTIGIVLVLVFSKYKTGTNSWFVNNIKYICIITLFVFFTLFISQMGCIENKYKSESGENQETSISRLRYLCPTKFEYIINAFDNGTLYVVLGVIFYIFCTHGVPTNYKPLKPI